MAITIVQNHIHPSTNGDGFSLSLHVVGLHDMGGSPGELNEQLVTQEKQKKGWRMNCDVGEALLILQAFSHFTYFTAHSPSFPSLYLRHSSFSNPSVALPTSKLILQPFRCFTYITAHSPTLLLLLLRHKFFTYSPGEPPMLSKQQTHETEKSIRLFTTTQPQHLII